ncbi:MAG: hypothetical protein QM783_04950 [Phycisphaerales bacterium]
MNTKAVFAALLLVSAAFVVAGPLDPPAGPVAPTAKPLVEIEPRTALSQANTPGDADSVFRITQPGSYYLTGNVTGASGKMGIEIAAGGVTVDLCGFTLAGVPGSLNGVFDASITGTTLKNGTISDWGGEVRTFEQLLAGHQCHGQAEHQPRDRRVSIVGGRGVHS